MFVSLNQVKPLLHACPCAETLGERARKRRKQEAELEEGFRADQDPQDRLIDNKEELHILPDLLLTEAGSVVPLVNSDKVAEVRGSLCLAVSLCLCASFGG